MADNVGGKETLTFVEGERTRPTVAELLERRAAFKRENSLDPSRDPIRTSMIMTARSWFAANQFDVTENNEAIMSSGYGSGAMVIQIDSLVDHILAAFD